jgi:hypothetical protein
MAAVFGFIGSAQTNISAPKANLIDELYWQGGDEANARIDNMMNEMGNTAVSRGTIIF